jgi:hypothetical protein
MGVAGWPGLVSRQADCPRYPSAGHCMAANAEGSRGLPLPAQGRRRPSAPLTHGTKTSRINSVAAAHWSDPSSRPCSRIAVRSRRSSGTRPDIPKTWSLKGECANLGIALPFLSISNAYLRTIEPSVSNALVS